MNELVELVGLDTRQAHALPRALRWPAPTHRNCRALAAAPDVIVLDESVAALDVLIQAQVLNLLADLHENLSVSNVLISHDLAVIRQLIDDVVVMHKGRIVEEGKIEVVLDNSREAYTRRLRASVPGAGWSMRDIRVAAALGGSGEVS